MSNGNTVRFTVELTLHEGKFDEFSRIAQDMLACSKKEPGTLGYDWYFSSDRKQCRLLETYVDANAMQAHMAGPAVQQGVPKLLQVSDISGFEVYGDPGGAGDTLKGFGAQIFGLWRALKE